MTINFQIEDNIALKYDGRLIDLHNNFDFEGFNYQTNNCELTLTFQNTRGDWINENEYKRLALIHTDVRFLLINYNNKKKGYPDDDKCLSDITFFPSSEREVNDGVLYQVSPTETDDIIYMFQSGYFIRVACETINLVVMK